MKTKMMYLTVLLAFAGFNNVFGQTKNEEFKVYGNCGMCETRIEKAAKSVDGVAAADWDSETTMLQVSFDGSKTDLHAIHRAVAKVGHDTDLEKASDKVYSKLPGCCKYDRTSAAAGDHAGHNH